MLWVTLGGAKVKDLMIASVGAGLVPALCSRLLFWGTHKGCPYGRRVARGIARVVLKKGLRAIKVERAKWKV